MKEIKSKRVLCYFLGGEVDVSTLISSFPLIPLLVALYFLILNSSPAKYIHSYPHASLCSSSPWSKNHSPPQAILSLLNITSPQVFLVTWNVSTNKKYKNSQSICSLGHICPFHAANILGHTQKFPSTSLTQSQIDTLLYSSLCSWCANGFDSL